VRIALEMGRQKVVQRRSVTRAQIIYLIAR
jgi:hypothetical protein